MVFRKGGKVKPEERWTYQEQKLEIVDCFNCLGVCLNYTGSGGGLESTSRLPLKTPHTFRANRLRKHGRFSQRKWGKVNIGLAGRNNAILVISTCQGELFQQVVIDKAVDNATGHALLRSLLGDGYRIMVPCIVRLHDKYPWLQISDSSQ